MANAASHTPRVIQRCLDCENGADQAMSGAISTQMRKAEAKESVPATAQGIAMESRAPAGSFSESIATMLLVRKKAGQAT